MRKILTAAALALTVLALASPAGASRIPTFSFGVGSTIPPTLYWSVTDNGQPVTVSLECDNGYSATQTDLPASGFVTFDDQDGPTECEGTLYQGHRRLDTLTFTAW